jgi:hypothetical protein
LSITRASTQIADRPKEESSNTNAQKKKTSVDSVLLLFLLISGTFFNFDDDVDGKNREYKSPSSISVFFRFLFLISSLLTLVFNRSK